MLRLKVIEVYRKSGNLVYKYKVQDIKGNTKYIDAEKLKKSISENRVELENYTLTRDNRLVRKNRKQRENSRVAWYALMNKDNIVAEFSIHFELYETYGKLPYDFTDMQEWVAIRSKFSCATNVREFFKSIGLKNADDIIEVTHCVSLHDTFWVKRTNSKLKWRMVSPFRRNYSDIISNYALEGMSIGNTNKGYFSPVISTNGSFPHTWKFNDGNITFIKAGSKYTLGGSNSGREPFSEYFASEIAEYLKFNHVKYSIRNHRRHDKKIDTVTECDCFTSEEKGTVTASLLGLDTYEKVIEYCKKLSKESLNTCIDMLFLDCLLLNTDRHFSNIEFFVNNDTLDIEDMTPIFDNNYSLLPRFIEGYDKFDRSEYTARDGRSFEELYKIISKHKNYRKHLIALKKFKLHKPYGVEISNERMKFLNKLLQVQVDYLLKL